MPVSSPHRYCQNIHHYVRHSTAFEVSSPHRYCQNLYEGDVFDRSEEFQALIGTAKTGDDPYKPELDARFKPS